MLMSSARGAALLNSEQSEMNFYGKFKASRNLLAKDNSGDLTYFRTGMKNKTRANAKIILYS